jgi:diguanylate cyclase (GGDEF)-like protein
METLSITDKIELLRKVNLFSTLDTEELAVVAQNSQMIHFPKGTLIFEEGEPSTEIYIVIRGDVLITRSLENDDIDLAQYIAGESFGELDLICNTPRDARAIAMRETDMLIFPQRGLTFSTVLQHYPLVSAQILYKLIVIIAGRVRQTHRLIKERTPWIQELKKKIFVDKLTGLYNRNFLFEDFKTLLPEYGIRTSVLLLKPDNFKELNDRFGHEQGDKALLLMAVFIQSIIREEDIAVRYGGDEFAIILPNTGRNEAISIAHELGRAIYTMDISRLTDGEKFNIRVSVGIATYPVHATETESLVQLCYEKMNAARSRGGNRIISPR